MKKKILSALVSAAMVLSLAGCAQNEVTPDEDEDDDDKPKKSQSSYSEIVNNPDEDNPGEVIPGENNPEDNPGEIIPGEENPEESKPESKPAQSSSKPAQSSSKPTQSSSSQPEEKPEIKDIDWSKVPVVDEMDLDYVFYEEGNIRYNYYYEWFRDELKEICSGGVVVITKYFGEAEYINLPDKIEGKGNIFISSNVNWGTNAKAIRFSDGCASPVDNLYFNNYSSIPTGAGIAPNVTTVVLPEKWKYIGAFGGLTSLKSIELPKETRRIWRSAFAGCKYLTSVTIPEKVEYINDNSFANCTSLKTINFPEKFAGECVIDYQAFMGCTALESVEIPEGVKQLGTENSGYGVFYRCTSLKKVSLPSTLKMLYQGTFSGCESLEEITIPNGLETISGSTFNGCKSLKEIDIPDSVTNIASGAFNGCTDIAINYKGKTYNEKNVEKLYNRDLSKM